MPKSKATSKRAGFTTNGRGTLMIERKFGGIAVRRASGTKSADELAEIIGLLDALAETGRLDIIREVQRGTVRAVEVLSRKKAGLPIDVPNLPAVATHRFEQAGKKWLAGRQGVSAGHLRLCRQHYDLVVRRWPGVTLDGLPDCLVSLRKDYEAAKHAVSFNNIRTSLLDFAKWFAGGKRSPLWHHIHEVPKLRASISAQRTHRPFDVLRAKRLADVLNATRAGAGDTFLTLCITGMRPSEYWGGKWALDEKSSCVVIRGTKSKAANRLVPLVMLGRGPVPPVLAYGRYSALFREVARSVAKEAAADGYLPWTLYDCRRTFAVWMEEARIPRTRRRFYLGHAKADVTDTYEERDQRTMTAAVRADSGTLTSYLLETYRAERDREDNEGARMRPQTKPQTPIGWDDDVK